MRIHILIYAFRHLISIDLSFTEGAALFFKYYTYDGLSIWGIATHMCWYTWP